jgi:hypothetical protein
MSPSGKAGLPRWWAGVLLATIVVLAFAGCGRSGFDVNLPAGGGRLQFQIDASQTTSPPYGDFCWVGQLVTAQGETPGVIQSSQRFPNVPGSLPTLYSTESEELQAGTWQLRVRFIAAQADGTFDVRLESTNCVVEVYADRITQVVLPQCAPSPVDESDASPPNMGNALTEGCVTFVTVSTSSSPAGATVPVSWGGITNATVTDWVGLFREGDADRDPQDPAGTGNEITWVYVSCTQAGGTVRAQGSCSFTLPSPLPAGAYNFRLFSNDDYTRLAVSNVLTVQ